LCNLITYKPFALFFLSLQKIISMQDSSKNIFRGLDTDSDDKYIDPSSYSEAYNIRITPNVDGTQTYAQNLPGNKLVGSWSNYTRGGVVVGKCQDYQHGFIFFFVASKNTATNKDFILKLDCNDDSVTTLIESNYLFPNYRTGGVLKANINPVISSCIYDNKLFYCDGTDLNYAHPPRYIDTTKTYSPTDDITDLISVSLVSPLFPVTCDVVFNTTNTINYLKNYSYQFLFRYVYESGEVSRFSPISKLAVSGYSQVGLYPIYIDVTYGAAVQYQVPNVQIKFIEFAFRENYTNDFKSFKKIAFPVTVNITDKISFYGNEAYTVVAENDYVTEYDNVPLFANSCEYADTRVFWANYKQDRYKLKAWSTNGSLLSYPYSLNKQSLKLGSKYKYAIDFIDHFGKRTTAYVSGTTGITPTHDVAIDVNGAISTPAQDGLLNNLTCQKVEINLDAIPSDIEAIEVRRSDNLTVSRFVQGRIEHAYYKTGDNVNGKPIFLKPIDWTTQNYTTFDYVSNKNTGTGGAMELYFDISNWAKSGINYTYAPGDKIKLLTANHLDTAITQKTDDYLIQRQEGDILVASLVTPQKSNCIASLRYGNSSANGPNFAMVGDNGGIWFKYVGGEYIKATKDNSNLWRDYWSNINFNGCCQFVYRYNGDYATSSASATSFYVVGDGGIILVVSHDPTTKLFEITEIEAYDSSKVSYRGVTCNTSTALAATDFSMFIIGDKNNNGNCTVLVDYTALSISHTLSLVDKSDDYALKGNGLKVKPNVRNNDVYIGYNDKAVYILTDNVDYIGKINLGTPISPSNVSCSNIGTANTSIWDAATKAKIKERRPFSLTPVLDSLVYVVGEAGLSFVIDSTPATPTVAISTDVLSFDTLDVCYNQFNGLSGNDRPLVLGVTSGDKVYTLAENETLNGVINPVRIITDPNFNYNHTSCVFSYIGSDFRIFEYCTSNNGVGLLQEKTISENNWSIETVKTNVPVLNYGAMIEVYTPAPLLSEQLYYEIGYSKRIADFVDVNRDGVLRLVLGDGGANTITTPYPYENVADGDCFTVNKQFYGRLWSKNKDVILAMTPQGDTQTAWNKDIGRPNFEDLTIKFATNPAELTKPFREFTSNISFSNPYIQGTATNGLRNFEFLNYKQLPIEYGAICQLQVANNTNEDGTILLSIHKRETVSIYIGKVQFTDVAGNNTISLSNQILGSYRTVQGSLGSVHTESITEYNSFVYGFDALKGVIWRYGQNGMTRLSDSGMRKFFYAQGKLRIDDDTKNIYHKVVSEYNPFYDEVIFSFQTGDYPSFSIVWSERLNRWVSFRQCWAKQAAVPPPNIGVIFHASMYQKMYSCFFGYKWTTESDVVQIEEHDSLAASATNSMYGINPLEPFQWPSTITFVANKNIDMVKTWENLATQTDEQWNVGITNEVGQASLIPSTMFKKLENNYYAPILRDTYSTGGTYNGLQLKSQTLKTTLTLNQDAVVDKAKIVKLYDAMVRFAISFRII